MIEVTTLYNISAEELHKRIVEDMLGVSKHFNMGLEDILERHNKHPLEQTIASCLVRLHLNGASENVAISSVSKTDKG